MSLAVPENRPIDGAAFRLGIVAARFNEALVDGLLGRVLDGLKAAGVKVVPQVEAANAVGKLVAVTALVVFAIFAGTPEVPWDWLPTALVMGLGGFIQTAVTCLPPLVRNPGLVRKPDDAGSVLPRLKAHLNPADPFFRHAVRLSLAFGFGTVFAMLVNHPHSYWIPMTIAWVAKPDQQGTTTRVVARILGTMIGLVFVALAVDGVSANTPWVVLVVGLGSAVALAFIWANYAIAVAGVTTFVIALFELIGVPVNATLPIRLLDTVLAGIITVAASFIWRSKQT